MKSKTIKGDKKKDAVKYDSSIVLVANSTSSSYCSLSLSIALSHSVMKCDIIFIFYII